MSDLNMDPLFTCTMSELKRGFHWNEESGIYGCLACGYETEQGVIYAAPDGTGYRDAEKQMKEHIASEHGSMFHFLLTLDKKRTGLSELQRQLLLLFYEGVSDTEVVRRTGAGSASTIRNHRFVLREKEKQARLFLALMELLQEKAGSEPDRSPKNRTPKSPAPDLADASADFPEGLDGPLRQWPAKENRRKEIAALLKRRFQPGRTYTEPEVNAILEQAWPDYAVLRRYMIEYGYLRRMDDGSAYWLPDDNDDDGHDPKKRRKELVLAYQEQERPGGVFLLRNKRNGKIGIGSHSNMEGAINCIKFELSVGAHRDRTLQQDWNDDGEAGFEFEVLEKLERRTDSSRDVRKELAEMEAAWMEKLQPFGERGYNGTADNKQKI